MKRIKLKKICISILIIMAIVNVINVYRNNIYANTVNEVENNIDEESGNCHIYYSKNNKSSDEKTGKNVKNVDKLGELNKISEVDINTPTQEKIESGEEIKGDHRYEKFNTALSKIFGVLIVTLQVASMAGIIFAGVRYMFASADSKADLKKGLIHLAIGMIIVFGASSVVGFVTRAFDDVFNNLM